MSLLQQIVEFFSGIFYTGNWPARWLCGRWTDFHGWLYIVSDLMIWAAYFAIPLLLFRLVTRRTDLPFPKIFWLFIAFILLCGSTHLMDALTFWWPAYHFSALLRFTTGVISIFTVFALYRILPLVYQIRTATQLEAEIEQRKKAEEQVRIQRLEHEKTKELLRVKDEFITLASHELKTPVACLKGYLQIAASLSGPEESEKNREFIFQANKQADKLTRLVNDLFNTAEIQIGEFPVRKSVFPISRVVRETIAQITAGSNTHAIDLKIISDADVEADFERVEQVISNLLMNAIKYSPLEKQLEVNVEAFASEVKVSIKDKGIGISPEKVPHLFDRYFRIENTSQNYSGLGLGLYISSQIIKKHGGKIGAESEPNQGSAFWFTLPIT